jgi:hypothetical protein
MTSSVERFVVSCEGQSHDVLLFADGTITLLNHDAEDLAVMSALGAHLSNCEKEKKLVEKGILYHDYLHRRKTWPLKYRDLSLTTIDQGTAKMVSDGKYIIPNPLTPGSNIVTRAFNFMNNNFTGMPGVRSPYRIHQEDTFDAYRESGWNFSDIKILWGCGVSPIMARAGRRLGLTTVHNLLRYITLGINDEFIVACEGRIDKARELGVDWTIWGNVPIYSVATVINLDQELETWKQYRDVAGKFALKMPEILFLNAQGYSPSELELWLSPLGLKSSGAITYLNSATQLGISLAERNNYLAAGIEDLEKMHVYIIQGIRPWKLKSLQKV